MVLLPFIQRQKNKLRIREKIKPEIDRINVISVQDKNVFQEAKNFRESIMKGEAKAVTEDIVDEQDSVNVKDDDAPF